MIFDIKIPTASGCLFAMCLKRRMIGDVAKAAVTKITVMQTLQNLEYIKKEGATDTDFNVVPTPVYRDGPTVPSLGAGEGGNTDVINTPAAEAAEESGNVTAAEVTEEAMAPITVTQEAEAATTTRSGREIRVPARFREEDVAALNKDGGSELLPSEVRYIAAMREIQDFSLQNIEVSENYPVDTSFVGMEIDDGGGNTAELHVLKYVEAKSSDEKQKWMRAEDEEHEQMLQHKVNVHMVPTANKSEMLNWVVLLVTEAELAAATSCAQ